MLCAREIMTREVISLAPESTIREAMEILSTNHLSGAPVVSGDRPVGVISMSDILAFIIDAPDPGVTERTESLADSWEAPADGPDDDDDVEGVLADDAWDEWEEGSDARVDQADPAGRNLLDQGTVEEAMNTEVLSVPPDASVRKAATMMRQRGIHRVLVTEGGRLVGIISALDIARAVSRVGLRGEGGVKGRICGSAPASWSRK